MNLFEHIDKLNGYTVCSINQWRFTNVEENYFFLDDTATEWTMNEETKYRERVLNYKVPYESTLVGKGTISTCEKQVRNKIQSSKVKNWNSSILL